MGRLNEYREDDRRSFRRFRFAEPVEFRAKSGDELLGSLSSDLSEGGVKLRLFKFVPVDTQLNIVVHLSSKKTVECYGKIVWVEKVAHTENYQAGVEFQNEGPPLYSRREIRNFLQSHQLA